VLHRQAPRAAVGSCDGAEIWREARVARLAAALARTPVRCSGHRVTAAGHWSCAQCPPAAGPPRV